MAMKTDILKLDSLCNKDVIQVNKVWSNIPMLLFYAFKISSVY